MQVSNNNQSYTNYNQYKEEIAKKLTEYAKNGDTEAIKKMVDEVVLSKVDSSSFDKYVEEMEGGKSSVADKFFSSLTKFIDDFVNGVNNTNNADKKEETKEPELFDVRKTNWSIVQQGIAAEIQNSKCEDFSTTYYNDCIGGTRPIFDLVNVDKNGKITLAKNAKETMKVFLHNTVKDQKESMQRVEAGNKLLGFNGTVATQFTQNDILKLFGLSKSGKIDAGTTGFPKWHKFINDLETYINDDNKIDELLSNFMSSVGSEDGNSTTLEKFCNNLANTEIKYVGTFLGSSDSPFYFNQKLHEEHIQVVNSCGRHGGNREGDIYDMLHNNYYYSRFLEKNNVSSNDNSANENKTINSNKTIQNNFVSSASPSNNFVSSTKFSNNFFKTTATVISNSLDKEYDSNLTKKDIDNTTILNYVPSEIFTENTKNENVKTSNIFTKIASTVKSEDIDGVLDAMERKNITKTYTNANKIGDAAGVDFSKTEFKKALEERKA